ncbi:uncharacterized protein LOC107768423 [Nicotiana tabacum]|uniref:Protein indeterminate-domain 12 n=1 Tax=Nicotiana tabacum TaxID=4097 RepID=A0A1S3XT33_TOBAC|nr:PREDICTED: protein indeterminate-domain 12-like [Nicotiana tabacum]
MIKGMVGDDSMSNLTSASNEASISSSNRTHEIGSALFPHHSLAPTNTQTQPAPTNKKKRNLPGNPDPEAEVIALSPKSLLATNRFVCEICNKGFQRDQNLQLHRRGHNLPWKLKQRTNKEVKKKVYVCPEPSCVHHHPSRALGDLTGIKKHFCRKHGEKKWKCEKCSKRYAVQSDWKAHSKICGTREYRCDCGTLFSRRDSFITHRAFCDALAEESVRTITTPTNPLISSSSNSHHLNLHTLQNFQLKQEQQQLSNFNLLPPHPSNELSSQLFIHNPTSSSSNNIFGAAAAAHMSATALLQKAAQIGVTSSSNSNSAASFFSPTTTTTTGMASCDLASREYHQFQNISANNSIMAPTTGNFVAGHSLASYGDDNNNNKGVFDHFSVNSGFMEQIHDMQNMMAAATTALPCTNNNNVGFDEGFGGANNPLIMRGKENNEGLTRDFLGLRAYPHPRDFFNNSTTTTTGLHHQMGSSSSAAASFDHHQQNQNQSPWQD